MLNIIQNYEEDDIFKDLRGAKFRYASFQI